MEYRYQLAPYTGKGSRIVCPECGHREFVPYIDTQTGEILHETCGRCNRETKCGYHLSPSEFFKQNPGARPQGDAWRQQDSKPIRVQPKLSNPICELPKDIVEKTIRAEPQSNFIKFMDTIFDPVITEGVISMYNLGVTKAGETIFYQQDRQGRFRGGKVIQYNKETGHRVKDTEYPVYWVHQNFQRNGFIPKDWKMTQCLFGEHLLDKDPDKTVYLVEAEKSACIGAAAFPEYVWLATGGKTQLGDKLNVLRGRNIVVIPDIDAYEDWKEYFESRGDLNSIVSDLVLNLATEEDRKNQGDVADLIIRECQKALNSVPIGPPFPSECETGRYFSSDIVPDIVALIRDLDLEIVSVTKLPSS